MVGQDKVREGYKLTEVGVIPEDWDCEKIKNVTRVTTGGTPSTKIAKFWNGDIPWMNSGELNLKKVYDVEGRISEAGLNNSSTKVVPSGSVLIGLAGQGKTRGTAAISYMDLCINQSIGAILPNNQIYSEYMYQNLDGRYIELRGLSTGDGGRGGLNLAILRNLSIAVPMIAEQTAIATALTDTDDLIRSLEKLIEKKRKIKQGAMQDLLTGRKRLPGFSGKWKRIRLGVHLKFQVGYPFESKYFNYKNEGIRLIKNGDLKNADNPQFYSGKYINEYIVLDKDVLIGMDGDFTICLWGNGKAVLNQRVGRILVDRFFNKLFFRYSLIRPLQDTQRSTSATTVKHLSHSDVENLVLFIPNRYDEQEAIAKVLFDMDSEIEALEQKLEKCKAIKQGMMQELLTGRIRLI